ncbi:glycosyltransferase family 4 protein [Peribacillus frigoritolerans]|uniref:glycosyltransferase family 4 protein n=1 Tax=Peribacillus frigoritolerans TaxID=450367 RepID=UPI00207A55FD|nr:glycosyltransferase family 4 protein [Peribacillus frigoritolerans]USK82052.1 glycosyltransferase family 4 protein [Peribacillus frigoritolerans]WJE49343.1 glycosyltransferase family 4 protein [Peribacillus frigoritolerans]
MKKILVLNHFPTVYPPTSGGTLRYFHIYNELSLYYDVTLLSQTDWRKGGVFQFSSRYREYKVKKDPLHKQIIQDFQNGEEAYEFALIINVELSKHPSLYKNYFDDLYRTSDIIIHESPYLLEYDRFLGLDDKPRIYNSHNHEYLLANQIWKNQKARNSLPSIYKLEKKLVEYADLVFATSEIERDNFISMYKKDPKKVKLAPNGIYPDEWLQNKEKSKLMPSAFFIGSDYPPNIEAVDYIIHHLADKCPDIEFIIAGGCCNSFSTIKKTNVKFLGRIHHLQKLKLLTDVDIAINPMFSGAGVNLKSLEFLSAGIPLFSTHCGVRGLSLIDKEHYIHAEKEDFAAKINQFCHKKIYLNEMSSRGQKYINANFSWSLIARSIYEEIEGILPV